MSTHPNPLIVVLLAALVRLERATVGIQGQLTTAALDELCNAQDQAREAIATAKEGAQ